MKLPRLFWQLLRYRVAVMLLLFLLLSVVIHESLSAHPLKVILAGICLAFSYISATSVNDLADREIDAVNHPDSPGRPLSSGRANDRDIWVAFSIASLAALLLAALISQGAVLAVAVSLLINVCYSLPPVRLSYRTFLAPLALGIGYVGVPYMLGLAIGGSAKFGAGDAGWLLGLYLMFIGRIILKDFRDRKGDKKFHKPTFLLRFGKNSTCLVSFLFIMLGGLGIIWQIRGKIWLMVITFLYLLAILVMVERLQKSREGKAEQVSIGLGAKMGNGLLITLLAVFVLDQAGSPEAVQMVAALGITVVFFVNFIALLQRPEEVILGYKG